MDGYTPPENQEVFQGSLSVVDGGFFDSAGIPIVQGRRLTDHESPDGQPVAILSEAMARRFWPGGDAVGQIVRRPGADDADLRVVGVVADIKVSSLGEAPRSMIYVPYSQVDTPMYSIVARTSADPEQTARAMLTAGRALDPELMVLEAKTMDRHLALMLLPHRLGALLLSVFGILALALAAIGLYGVVSYAVSSRTREVGIRLALGADAPAVVRLLTASGVRLVAMGGAIGLALSLLISRLLSRLLFGVGTLDPVTFVAAPLVLGAVALLAAYLPARRATRVDPVAALRAD